MSKKKISIVDINKALDVISYLKKMNIEIGPSGNISIVNGSEVVGKFLSMNMMEATFKNGVSFRDKIILAMALTQEEQNEQVYPEDVDFVNSIFLGHYYGSLITAEVINEYAQKYI